ncbi:hypothetical protein H5410_032482 [Solanum commersonii]|uniref:Uncharacterized protein n=1 Tax=Solanum commersonii TaxID=4109 RepID=A0A9J5YN14_SOLCO|nr:hypothetical protein H5410_032482 [Solanum commersonii]
MSGSTPNFFGAKLTASTVLQMCFRRIRAVCLEFIAWHLDSIGLFHRTLPLSLLQAGQVFSSSTATHMVQVRWPCSSSKSCMAKQSIPSTGIQQLLLKMVLRLVGCCLEFAEPVVVYSCWDYIT